MFKVDFYPSSISTCKCGSADLVYQIIIRFEDRVIFNQALCYTHRAELDAKLDLTSTFR